MRDHNMTPCRTNRVFSLTQKILILFFSCFGINGFLTANNDQVLFLQLAKEIWPQEIVKNLVKSAESFEQATNEIRSLVNTCKGIKSLLIQNKQAVINHVLQRFNISAAEAQSILLEQVQSGKGRGLEIAILKQAGADLNALSSTGDVKDPPLIMAARNGHISIIPILLSAGANKDIQNKLKDTALMVAIMKKHEEIAALLINAGANVHLMNNLGSHALTLAAKHNQAPIVDLLLKHGANANQTQGEGGYTALMLAIISGATESINLLLNDTIDVNKKNDITGHTPLILASILSNTKMVERLLEAGADPTPQDTEGKTALDYATNSHIIELLQEAIEPKSNQN